MSNVKFSIIIAFWNIDEIWLDRCIHSILNTNYRKIEIILVDDGSDKNKKISKNIFDLLKKEKIDYKFLELEHKGNAISKKIGSEHCSDNSDYLWFVDSDDEIKQNSFSKLIDFIDRNPNVDIINFSYDSYYCQNNNFDNYLIMETPKRDYKEFCLETNNLIFNKAPINVFNKWEWSNCLNVYRIEFLKSINFSFYDGKHRFEDVFNSIVVNSFASRIGATNEKLYIYWRNRESSITNNMKFNLNYATEMMEIIKESFFVIDNLYLKKNLDLRIEIFNRMVFNIVSQTLSLIKHEGFLKRKKLKKEYLSLIEYKYINFSTKQSLKKIINNAFNSFIWKIFNFLKKAIYLFFKDPKRFFNLLFKFNFLEI